MHHCDVLVVGAGPAGSAAAATLARLGRETLLVETHELPRNKTCGDALTPRALAALEALGLLDRVSAEAARIERVGVVAPSGRALESAFPQSNRHRFGLVLPRRRLDQLLAQHAESAGAGLWCGSRVTGLERQSEVWRARVVRCEAGSPTPSAPGEPVEIEARAVVLATGANVTLAASAGWDPRPRPGTLAARAYLQGLTRLPSAIEFHFDGVPLPAYGWIFPVTPSSDRATSPSASATGTANVGAMVYPAARVAAREAYRRFVTAPAVADRLRGGTASVLEGYPLRTDYGAVVPARGSALLVGEAAGLVNPLTGEGIDYALESGRTAAEVIDDVWRRADLSALAAAYASALRERYDALFRFSRRLRDFAVRRAWLNQLVRLAGSRPDLERRLVEMLQGDANATHNGQRP